MLYDLYDRIVVVKITCGTFKRYIVIASKAALRHSMTHKISLRQYHFPIQLRLAMTVQIT